MPNPTALSLTELRTDFLYNDRDRDGRINYKEFCNLLDDLEAGMTSDDARIGFREIDTNRDELIDFEEFVAWWMSD